MPCDARATAPRWQFSHWQASWALTFDLSRLADCKPTQWHVPASLAGSSGRGAGCWHLPQRQRRRADCKRSLADVDLTARIWTPQTAKHSKQHPVTGWRLSTFAQPKQYYCCDRVSGS